MKRIERTLDVLKPRKRQAPSNALVTGILIAVSISAIAIVFGQFLYLVNTTNVSGDIEITNPAMSAAPGHITIQVKNNGKATLNDVYATVLVNALPTNATATCTAGTGIVAATIGDPSADRGTMSDLPDLAPGESITISGNGVADSDGTYDGSTTALDTCSTFKDHSEYVIQVNAKSDDDAYDVSKSIITRAR